MDSNERVASAAKPKRTFQLWPTCGIASGRQVKHTVLLLARHPEILTVAIEVQELSIFTGSRVNSRVILPERPIRISATEALEAVSSAIQMNR